jgi:2-polyprenyl-3-methyl-5-hydroxy-6-metoxy-1,4-benzoquinol methylase
MTTGSYEFDTFDNNFRHQEIQRLRRKSNILLEDIDHPAWEQIGLTAGMTVLDVGCGTGLLSCELAKVIAPGHVTGIDSSTDLLAIAQKHKTDQALENLDFSLGNIYELDFPDDHFDVVYMRFVMQHLREPQKALQSILRVLKPSGKVCIIDVDDRWFSLYPEPESFREFQRQVAFIQQTEGGDPFVGGKLSVYLRKEGFGDVRTKVQVLTTDEYGSDRLLGMLSFGAPYYGQYPEFSKMAQCTHIDVKNAIITGGIWVSVGLFICIAHKQTPEEKIALGQKKKYPRPLGNLPYPKFDDD